MRDGGMHYVRHNDSSTAIASTLSSFRIMIVCLLYPLRLTERVQAAAAMVQLFDAIVSAEHEAQSDR